MIDNNIRAFHLWSGLPNELWDYLKAGMREVNFARGETIFPCRETDQCLCVLRQGAATVYANSSEPNHAALLRTMEAGSVFGVHCVFSADVSPQSHIVAQKSCHVLLIPCALWEKILAAHPATMASYIRFLTQRIQFLNRKICFLTAGSAERRLALYLLSEIPEENVPVTLDISVVSLADLLNLGRASLYRAMDQLSTDGFLVRNGREYRLLMRNELSSHYR